MIIQVVSDYMIQPPDYIYYESDDMKTVMKKFQNTSAWNLPVIKITPIMVSFLNQSY